MNDWNDMPMPNILASQNTSKIPQENPGSLSEVAKIV